MAYSAYKNEPEGIEKAACSDWKENGVSEQYQQPLGKACNGIKNAVVMPTLLKTRPRR